MYIMVRSVAIGLVAMYSTCAFALAHNELEGDVSTICAHHSLSSSASVLMPAPPDPTESDVSAESEGRQWRTSCEVN